MKARRKGAKAECDIEHVASNEESSAKRSRIKCCRWRSNFLGITLISICSVGGFICHFHFWLRETTECKQCDFKYGQFNFGQLCVPSSDSQAAFLKDKAIVQQYRRGQQVAERKSVIMAGLLRNIGGSIDRLFQALYELGSAFLRHQIIILENDSTDRTRERLKYHCKYDAIACLILHLPELGQRQDIGKKDRIKHMTTLRQRLLNEIHKVMSASASAWDFVLMFDGDIFEGWPRKGFSTAGLLTLLGYRNSSSTPLLGDDPPAVTCSNVITDNPKNGRYRDMHALRQHSWDEKMPPWNDKTAVFFTGNELLPVKSCFSGIALYDARAIRKSMCNYTFKGDRICEHVPFHHCMAERGFGKAALYPMWFLVFQNRRKYPLTCANLDSCPIQSFIWSRGFARTCCDIYPRCFHSRGHLEHASVPGLIYGDEVPFNVELLSKPGITVYVPSADLTMFVAIFKGLPSTTRLTLVTGSEDIGIPREAWGEGRKAMNVSGHSMPLHYQDLIADPRLNHWFTQNYDLTGCSRDAGCSKHALGGMLSEKMTPIPVGLDLHTQSEKLGDGNAPALVEKQLDELRTIAEDLPPFFSRSGEQLLIAFGDSGYTKERHHALYDHQLPSTALAWLNSRTSSRSDFWREIGRYKFVAAPCGHGLDTHRLWEVLALGSVPVVRTSSLDILYRDFPVIIVPSWSSITESSFSDWGDELITRFGPNPFDSRMHERLTMKFWVNMVRRKANSTLIKHCLPLDTGAARESWDCHG